MVVAETTETEQRRPQAVPPARIAPLPNLPLFHKLAGRQVLVAGSSPGALWKAELLAAAGADVHVAAGSFEGAAVFADLAANPPAGSLVVDPRSWTEADFIGATIAIADLGDAADAERFATTARAAGVPVNIVDRTEACDFTFGTIVNRDPIVLAISTDGGAPMLGQSIRARIEAILPANLSAWGKAALAWRGPLKRRLPDFVDRRAFWERFTHHAWSHVDRPPSDEDREVLLSGSEFGARHGRVLLVGAGPGDPELLTLKAVRALQAASVILYDDLVDPRVLELARREARRVAVGKKGRGPSCRQKDINDEIVALAGAGETVVRLKGGDPLVFGRASEEYDACRHAAIPVEIVPGISAGQATAAALGFSLTERHVARRIQFITGHGADGKLPQDLNWPAIADPLATTIIYMGRGTLAEFVEAAIANGLDAETPAVAVAAATSAEQVQVAGAIAALPRLARTLPAEAPVTIILGKVARAAVAPAAVAASQAVSAAR